MTTWKDDPGHGGNGGPLFPSLKRRRKGSRTPLAALAVLLLAGGAGVAWFFLRSDDEAAAPPSAPVQDAGEPAPGFPFPEPPPATELPELAESDSFIRTLAERLSSHPRFAAWLVTDDLLHRFVVTVVNLSGGGSPAEPLDFMAPEEEFPVVQRGPTLVMDPAGFRRYDVVAEVFTSLDTPGTVELYRTLRPLIEETYEELGLGEEPFDELLAQAVRNLLAVRVPESPLEVYPGEEGVVYEFRDPELEGRSEAAKHLFRMGPDNAERVQEKLRELAGPLGIRLPD